MEVNIINEHTTLLLPRNVLHRKGLLCLWIMFCSSLTRLLLLVIAECMLYSCDVEFDTLLFNTDCFQSY